MKDNIITLEHHGVSVSGFAHLEGKHRSICLCWQGCKHFKPGSDGNCEIAALLYRTCNEFKVTTPVIECARFEI